MMAELDPIAQFAADVEKAYVDGVLRVAQQEAAERKAAAELKHHLWLSREKAKNNGESR